MLETFGVSIDSEAGYRALLQHPDQDLEGLARPTTAPRSRTSSRTP